MEQSEDLSHMLNQVIMVETIRPNGTIRIQQDFKYCPSLAEQHTAHLSDINYLIEKYSPDEIGAYMAQRSMARQEIQGHDFSVEPNLQEAKNQVYVATETFKQLPENLRSQFKNALEFLKYIDNPENVDKLTGLGILTKKQVQNLQSTEQVKTADEATINLATQEQTTQTAEEAKQQTATKTKTNNPPRK